MQTKKKKFVFLIQGYLTDGYSEYERWNLGVYNTYPFGVIEPILEAWNSLERELKLADIDVVEALYDESIESIVFEMAAKLKKLDPNLTDLYRRHIPNCGTIHSILVDSIPYGRAPQYEISIVEHFGGEDE